MPWNFIAPVLSLVSATLAGIFAWKTYEQNKYAHLPVLVPYVGDVSDAHRLIVEIRNEGSGIAKDISIKSALETSNCDTDLMPKRFTEHAFLKYEPTLVFGDGANPLFTNPELEISYHDIFGRKHKTTAHFRPDTTEARRLLGHIDKSFTKVRFN